MGMEIGDQNRDIQIGLEEIDELADRRIMADMHLSRRGIPDIDRGIRAIKHGLQFRLGDDLLCQPGDERQPIHDLGLGYDGSRQ